MANRTIDHSPPPCARIAGRLYLIRIACVLFRETFVRGQRIVAADAVTAPPLTVSPHAAE